MRDDPPRGLGYTSRRTYQQREYNRPHAAKPPTAGRAQFKGYTKEDIEPLIIPSEDYTERLWAWGKKTKRRLINTWKWLRAKHLPAKAAALARRVTGKVKHKDITRKQVVLAALGAVLVLNVAGWLYLRGRTPHQQAGEQGAVSSGTPQVAGAADAKPDFTPVLPDGSESSTDNGLVFEPEKKVVKFTDSINGTKIIVSQQQLPDGMKNDPSGGVAALAKQNYFSEQVDAGGTPVYIGTSAKGPQTALFTKNDLLIFIQSETKIETVLWGAYVTGLR